MKRKANRATTSDAPTVAPTAAAAPAVAAIPQAAPAAPVEPPARPGMRLVALCGVAVVAIAMVGYGVTGTPEGIGAAKRSEAPADAGREQFAGMVAQLAARMQDKPEPQGMQLLARSYSVLGDAERALATYRKALEMAPDDPTLLADMADLIGTRSGKLEGEPAALVARALKADPNHLKALGLGAMVAWQAGDRATATRHWKHMIELGPPDNEMVKGAVDAMATLVGQPVAGGAPAGALPPMGGTPAAPGVVARAAAPNAAPHPTGNAAAAGAAQVSGRVSLSDALKGQVSPDDVVFVFARPAEGPRMPLAALRKKVSELPLDFKLDDSLAMSPQMRLSSATRVVVGARISKSGSANVQAGDLEVLSAPVAVGTRGIELRIDSRR